MRVVVTGGGGRLGIYVTHALARAQHDVLAVDVNKMDGASAGVVTLQADLTDAGQVYSALAGADAVVHFGAIADAGLTTDPKTFNDNTTMTYNVLQAASDLGIRRVISASSNQAHGLAGSPPVYVPVDDSHPARPINSYALSKVVGEQVADYFAQRKCMEVLSFRILNAQVPSALPSKVAEMVAQPELGARTLWTVTDARDVAAACQQAIEAPGTLESGVYYIAGPTCVMPDSTAKLVAEHYGAQTEVRGQLGHALTRCDRAERVFGWRAKYGWTVTQSHPESQADIPPMFAASHVGPASARL